MSTCPADEALLIVGVMGNLADAIYRVRNAYSQRTGLCLVYRIDAAQLGNVFFEEIA